MQNREALSRRSFVAGAGLALAGLGLTACGQPQTATKSDDLARTSDIAWDEEVDFLVVGSGTAALGALAATESPDAKVMLIDKADTMFGGTSATSGGGFWIPMNYLQADEGIEDSREMALNYVSGCAEGRAPQAAIEAFVDNAAPWLERVHDLTGVEFKIGGAMDYYDNVEGYLARGRNSKIASGNAGELWQAVQKLLEDRGCEIRMGTALTQLVTDESGAVMGVIADDGSGTVAIKAGAVLLGTGGFDHNPEMMREHITAPIYVSNASTFNTGDGHRAAAKVGAKLTLMSTYWGLPSFYPGSPESFDPASDVVFDVTMNDWNTFRVKPHSLVVNAQGKRFGDEATMYPVFTRGWGNYDSGSFSYSNAPAYFVCDAEFVSKYRLPGMGENDSEPTSENFVKADTLEELAVRLGIDAEGLAAEVERFNAFAAEGVDGDFHRGEKTSSQTIFLPQITDEPNLVNPLLGAVATPPFYGAVYVPATCGTSGGMQINEHAQVLDVDGEPISGLYACGNCAAAISGGAYLGGGGTLGPGCTMADLAARHALGL